MAGLSDYEGPGQIFWNGSLLGEAKSVKVSHKGNGSDVNTMHKGFAGQSKGAFKATITVENMIPVAGLEKRMREALIDFKNVKLVVVSAGYRLAYDCKIDEDDSDNSIENAASYSFTAVAGKPKVL